VFASRPQTAFHAVLPPLAGTRGVDQVYPPSVLLATPCALAAQITSMPPSICTWMRRPAGRGSGEPGEPVSPVAKPITVDRLVSAFPTLAPKKPPVPPSVPTPQYRVPGVASE
jgi:hypothetical protein